MMLGSSWPLLDLALALIAIVLVRQLVNRLSRSAPLPPGPRGLPIIGNVLDMPTSQDWVTFADWGKKYGDMTYINLIGQPMLIVNSVELAVELLEKKSSIYSDRAVLTLCGETIGWKYGLGLLAYGEKFREFRRFFARSIGTKLQVERFATLQELQARKFLEEILHKPEDLDNHVRRLVGASILKLAYGYDAQDGPDPFLELAEAAMTQLSQLAHPGAHLVDIFPILLHLPQWFPGGSFRKTIAPCRKTLTDLTELPFEYVKSRMQADTYTPSFTSDLLESEKLDEEKLFNIKWSAMSLYAAGSDTSVSTIRSFFLAMMLYPEVQRRAQEELDTVIGEDRLPTLADRKHLPYVEALVSELHRWNPVLPQGIPHRLIQDDIHNGYLIPKGTLVVSNQWLMLHDPKDYTDPYTFDPTRYFVNSGKHLSPDPRKVCFGFGRRICPGSHFADASIFISCAMTLATFDISKPTEYGRIVEPQVQYSTGVVSHPAPFRCSVRPRSAKVVALSQHINQ